MWTLTFQLPNYIKMKWYITFQIYASRIVIISISKLFTFSTVNIFLTKILWLDVFTQKRVNKEDGEMKNQHEAEDHIFLLPAKTKPSILFCLDICYVDFFCCLRIYILWSFYLLLSTRIFRNYLINRRTKKQCKSKWNKKWFRFQIFSPNAL